MTITRKILLIVWCLVICIDLVLAYSAYMRHKRMHEPCVTYYPGMTLLPGQCATVKVKVVPPAEHDPTI